MTTNKKSAKEVIVSFAKDWMSLVGIALLLIVFTILSRAKFGEQYFLTWSNFKNILLQTSAIAIVAIGQSILLLGGNFDLSLGRMLCLTSCVGAILMKAENPMPLGIIIALMFLIGLVVGAINGTMVAIIGVPAMIATLGTQYICYGLAKLITQAVPIPKMPEAISWLGRGYVGEIPVCAIIMVVLYVIAQFLTTKTKAGRNIYAVGGSKEAAFFSGINVKAYHFGTFILGSILSTFGGLVLMSRLNSVAVTNGQNYEFDGVISSIIGGVSLAGGKGRVIGTMFGALFLNILFNGFSQMGVDPFVQDVLKGIVLVLAVTLDVIGNMRKS